jgi:hypothetical protein
MAKTESPSVLGRPTLATNTILSVHMADDEKWIRKIAAKATCWEILDGMEIVATNRSGPLKKGHFFEVELIDGSTFSLHVEQPEGKGAVVSYYADSQTR